MAGLDDPFPQVQQEVRAAWALLSKETLTEAERVSRLEALDQDVRDLQMALDIARAEPERFRLSPADLSTRAAFVNDMGRAISAARARLLITNKDTNSNTKLNKKMYGNENGKDNMNMNEADRLANDAFVDDELRAQSLALREQDEGLDELASAVQRIGHLGRDMHAELEEQGELLQDIGGRFDGTLSRMKAVRLRVDRVIQHTGRKQFCTIIWLSITFLILTVLVVMT